MLAKERTMNQEAWGDRLARRCLLLLGAVASAAALVACDATEDVLEGTAATGAPIVAGTVDVVCSSGAALQTTTNDSGAWRVSLGDRKLPCKMRVKGGKANNVDVTQEFHSVATVSGIANITPLTDLAVAQLAKESPATWFAKKEAADFAAISTDKVTAAVSTVVNSLGVKDFLAGDNPLTTAFTAKVTATDKIDKALEALKAVNYADVLAAASSSASSEAFTSAVATYKTSIMAALPPSNGGGGEGSGDQGGGGQLPASLSGKGFVLAFKNPQPNSPFAAAQVYDFVFSSSGMLFYAPTGTSPQREIATFKVEDGEYRWFDAEKSLLFAVSFKPDGSFNEINVSSSSTPSFQTFLGQFSPVTSGSDIISSWNPAACSISNGAGGCRAGVVADFSLVALKCNIIKSGSNIIVKRDDVVIAEITLGGEDDVADKAVPSNNYFSFAVREGVNPLNILNLSIRNSDGVVMVADGSGNSIGFDCKY
jgi:hypothetical protein